MTPWLDEILGRLEPRRIRALSLFSFIDGLGDAASVAPLPAEDRLSEVTVRIDEVEGAIREARHLAGWLLDAKQRAETGQTSFVDEVIKLSMWGQFNWQRRWRRGEIPHYDDSGSSLGMNRGSDVVSIVAWHHYLEMPPPFLPPWSGLWRPRQQDDPATWRRQNDELRDLVSSDGRFTVVEEMRRQTQKARVFAAMSFRANVPDLVYDGAVRLGIQDASCWPVRFFPEHPSHITMHEAGLAVDPDELREHDSWVDYSWHMAASSLACIVDLSYATDGLVEELEFLSPRRPCLFLAARGSLAGARGRLREATETLRLMSEGAWSNNTGLLGVTTSGGIDPVGLGGPPTVLEYPPKLTDADLVQIRGAVSAWLETVQRQVLPMSQQVRASAKALFVGTAALDGRPKEADAQPVAADLLARANRAWHEGRHEEAERLAKDADHRATVEIDRLTVVGALHLLGLVAAARGQVDNARDLYRRSFEVARRLGDPARMAISLYQQADLEWGAENRDLAIQNLRHSAELARQAGDSTIAAMALGTLGAYLTARGDVRDATAVTAQAAVSFDRVGAGPQLGLCASWLRRQAELLGWQEFHRVLRHVLKTEVAQSLGKLVEGLPAGRPLEEDLLTPR